MKRALLIVLLLVPFHLAAQSTTVSSTGVVDTDGFTWANGSYNIQFVPSPSFPSINSYTWSGGNLKQNALFQNPLNGSGAFSVAIPSNNAINPSGSMWKFTICPNASKGCFTVTLAVTGTTQDLTTILNASALGPRFASDRKTYGYGTVEVNSNAQPGDIFFNTTTQVCSQWSSSTGWQNCANGTSGNPAAPFYSLQYNASGVFGGATPFTLDPSATFLNGANQYQKGTNFGFTPTLPGTGNFSQYVANQYFSNTYTQQLPNNQAFSSLGIYDLHLDGGVNQNQNGLSFKPGLTPISIVGESRTPGSLNPISIINYQFSKGDTFGIYNNAVCYGGTSAAGDEGCENNDEGTFQGSVDYNGPITAGGSTGSTSVTVNPSQGTGTQGVGRYLLDLNHTLTAGSISNLVRNAAGYSTYTGSGTGWPVSTVNTTLGTAITGLPGVYTVTPASMSGITTSTVLCIADAGNFETVIPTTTTGTTFTAFFNDPQLSTAIVSSGGGCGYYIGINADIATGNGITGNLLWVFPVIRTTSSTSADVWIAHQGAYAPYGGSWNNTTNTAYTLYPGAEVLHLNNGGTTVTSTLTLAPNTVAWSNGDTVDLPLYPDISQQGGNSLVYRYLPPAQGGSWGRTYQFGPYFAAGPAGGNSGLFRVNNNTANSYYSTTGHIGPILLDTTGYWKAGLNFAIAPPGLNQNGAIVFHACPITGCGLSNVFSAYVGSGSGDNWQYNTATGAAAFSVGFGAATVGLGPDGTISTPGQLQARPGAFGTAQNLALYSQFPSSSIGSTWVSQGTNALASQTSNAATDPNGNMTAETVTAPTLTSMQSAGQGQTISVTSGSFYTVTFCFRGHAGGEFIEYGIVGDTNNETTVTLTTSWQCVYTIPLAGVSSSSIEIYWAFIGTAGSGATADVAFAQLENTSYHGQYVVTTNASVNVIGMVTTNSYVSGIENVGTVKASGNVSAASFTSTTGPRLFSAIGACNTTTGPQITEVSDVSSPGSVTFGQVITSGTGTPATPSVTLHCNQVSWTVMAK